MATFINSIQSVSIILLLTLVGYLLSAKGWLNKDAKVFINKLLMTLCVPSTCIYGLCKHLTRETLTSAGTMLLVPFFTIGGCFVITFFLGRLLKVPQKTLGVFMVICSISNSMFIGYPVCHELFGDEGIPYIMTYYAVSTMFTQAVSMSVIRWSAQGGGMVSPKALLKMLKTPCMGGIFAGFFLVLTGIRLPEVAMSCIGYLNDLTTPLALMVTGHIIYQIGLKNLHITRYLAIGLLFRFGVSPLINNGLCALFGVTGLAQNVFVIQSAMPVQSVCPVAAAEYGADEETAAQGTAISTLAMFVVIPIIMLLISG